MATKKKIGEAWVGKSVELELEDGSAVSGTIERIDGQQVFIKETDGRKMLCFNSRKILNISEA